MAYRAGLSDSRKGVRADEEQLLKINDLITPLIKKGQSLNHIFSNHSEELTCSRKTMYNYIDRNLFTVKNIDLPRKVRYRRRKKKPSEPRDYKYRVGRTYKDFKAYIAQNPNVGIVEMDTVKGRREKGKVMLTMVFVKYDFMITITNHINSFSRDSLGGKSPFDAAENFLGVKLPQILGFKRIKPDDIILNPSLLSK
jgi:IS30 family transposase